MRVLSLEIGPNFASGVGLTTILKVEGGGGVPLLSKNGG